MSKFTIFTMIYDDYYMLRQFIESIFNNIDLSTYEQIVILDDYSNPEGKLREYENWLEKEYKNVRVIKFKEHRKIKYYQDKISDKEDNLGIGAAFDLVMNNYINTEYAFNSDVDVIFLKKSKYLLNDLSFLLDNNEDVQIIGQTRGIEDTRILKIYEWFEYWEKRTKRIEPNGGDIGPVMAALRTKAFTELNLRIDSGSKLGATFGHFTSNLIQSGKYASMSFPLFTDMYAVHLGGGVVRRNSSEKELGFIFLNDVLPARGGVTGPRIDGSLRNRTYGRPFINMTNEYYLNYIKDLYDKPFDKIQNTIDESLIYSID